jgi:hypothetical protein
MKAAKRISVWLFRTLGVWRGQHCARDENHRHCSRREAKSLLAQWTEACMSQIQLFDGVYLDIALRLVASLVVGGLIGLERVITEGPPAFALIH